MLPNTHIVSLTEIHDHVEHLKHLAAHSLLTVEWLEKQSIFLAGKRGLALMAYAFSDCSKNREFEDFCFGSESSSDYDLVGQLDSKRHHYLLPLKPFTVEAASKTVYCCYSSGQTPLPWELVLIPPAWFTSQRSEYIKASLDLAAGYRSWAEFLRLRQKHGADAAYNYLGILLNSQRAPLLRG